MQRRTWVAKGLLLGMVIATAVESARWAFDHPIRARLIVMGLEERPYVYRVLVAWLGRLLVALGLPADVALTLVIVLSAVGLVYAVKYLLPASNDDLRGFLLAAASVELFMLLFFQQSKVYDLSTAALFAASLGLLARGKIREYYVWFPVVCLNRETSFLLIILFAVYCWKELERKDWALGVLYQALAFILIRLFLVWLYADNAGVPFLFRPTENLIEYILHPWWSLLFLTAGLGVLGLCMRNWKRKPVVLRTAFLVLAPPLAALFLFFGWPFEIRVFAEVYPVAFVLAAWTYLK